MSLGSLFLECTGKFVHEVKQDQIKRYERFVSSMINSHCKLSLQYYYLNAPLSAVLTTCLCNESIIPFTKNKRPYFTKAFTNVTAVNQINFLISFLRSHTDYCASLFFNSIRDKFVDPIHLSYITIPSIYQQGWCAEEQSMWGSFLLSYLDNIGEKGVCTVDNSSILLSPFMSYFLHTISLDYFRIVINPVLSNLNNDEKIQKSRLNFQMRNNVLAPYKYFDELIAYMNEIITGLRSHSALVGYQIRRLLRDVSKKDFVVNNVRLCGVKAASFIFLFCSVIPVLRNPKLIGMNLPCVPDYILDDMISILVFANHKGLIIPSPNLLVLVGIIDSDQFVIDDLIESFITSPDIDSNDVFEVKESLFMKLMPNYQKSSIFVPLDLYYIHKMFVNYSKVPPPPDCGLAAFDYLLKVEPSIDNKYSYQLFNLTLKCSSYTDDVSVFEFSEYDSKMLDSANYIADHCPPAYIEALESYKNITNDRQLAVRIRYFVDHYDEGKFMRFLRAKKKYEDNRREKMLEERFLFELSHKQANTKFSLISDLIKNISILICHRFVDYFIQHSQFCLFDKFDTNTDLYCSNYNAFDSEIDDYLYKFTNTLELEAPINDQALKVLHDFLRFYLIDRISIRTFSRHISKELVEKFESASWSSNQEIMEIFQVVDDYVNSPYRQFLVTGVSYIVKLQYSESIAYSFHMILQAVNIATFIFKDEDQKAKICICTWMILQSVPSCILTVFEFIDHFYPDSSYLMDPIANEKTEAWNIFWFSMNNLKSILLH